MKLSRGLAVAAVVAGCASPAAITGVSVRDADYEVVKVLAPDEVAEFRRQWEDKQEVKAPPSDVEGQHFKLDIERQDSGGRWLYQTTGYVRLLSKEAKPIYKVQDPEAFNRLIGAAK
jgi:hypothetical protein